MKRLLLIASSLAIFAACLAPAAAAPAVSDDGTQSSGSVYARIDEGEIVIGNHLVERTWERAAFATSSLVDKRGSGRTWSSGHADF